VLGFFVVSFEFLALFARGHLSRQFFELEDARGVYFVTIVDFLLDDLLGIVREQTNIMFFLTECCRHRIIQLVFFVDFKFFAFAF